MYFKDGTSYTNATYLLGHDLDLDEAETDVCGKYEEIMHSRVGKERADKICQVLMNLECIDDVSEFVWLLCEKPFFLA